MIKIRIVTEHREDAEATVNDVLEGLVKADHIVLIERENRVYFRVGRKMVRKDAGLGHEPSVLITTEVRR